MQGTEGMTTGLFNAQEWRARVECPACRSAAVTTTRTMPIAEGETSRVRYHKCRICSANFKSVESLLSLSIP
jgi:formate dehydrogenase maturation protein FdhE